MSNVAPAKLLNKEQGPEKEVANLYFQKVRLRICLEKIPNLKLQCEDEKYNNISVQANFTTHTGINFSTLILLLTLFKVLICHGTNYSSIFYIRSMCLWLFIVVFYFIYYSVIVSIFSRYLISVIKRRSSSVF